MARAATSIQAGTRIAGRIEGKGDLDVFGKVEGSIVVDGDVLIDGDARVDADVQARQLSIHGIYTGNCQAERIELFESAIVVGDLRAAQVVVADGARFRGLIDMGEFGEGDDDAPRRASRARTSSRSSASSSRRSSSRSAAKASKPASSKAAKGRDADEAPADDAEE